MSKRIVYIAGRSSSDYGYCNWMNIDSLTNDIHKATAVMGLGGSDVSNVYYDQPNSGYLHCSPVTDKAEYEDFQKAIELKIPLMGTCKFLQWCSALQVKDGRRGAIFQHIEHPSYHPITTFDGKTLMVNSLHHNLADLSRLKENEDYKLLAWAEELSPVHINGYKQNCPCKKEPEVVYFPNLTKDGPRAIGWQNHNEMMYRSNDNNETIQWSQGILDRFFDNSL